MKLLYMAFRIIRLTILMFLMYFMSFVCLNSYGDVDEIVAYIISTMVVSFTISFMIVICGVSNE